MLEINKNLSQNIIFDVFNKKLSSIINQFKFLSHTYNSPKLIQKSYDLRISVQSSDVSLQL
jgi:hypothetical protein